MKPKSRSLGMIELALAGPELIDIDGQSKQPDLPDLVAVLNLHGDANANKYRA